MDRLSNGQQALLMLAAFTLPAVGTWSAFGFPMDRFALGLMTSNVITGALVAIKELLGNKGEDRFGLMGKA